MRKKIKFNDNDKIIESQKVLKSKIDAYDREDEINDLIQILKVINDNKKGAIFALNGERGIGKSWFLDLFNSKINNEAIVIRYDAWNTDFYDEPLFALLKAMICSLNQIIKENKLKDFALSIVKTIFEKGTKVLGQISEYFTGVDLVNFTKDVKFNYKKISGDAKISDDFDLNNILFETKEVVRDLIIQLSQQDLPIVIIVDEIDRCLPEYALKVLERLHHLIKDNNNENIPNVNIIVAVDKKELERGIDKLYGVIDGENRNKYLKKIFDFTFTLKRKRCQNYKDKYFEYFRCFENLNNMFEYKDVEEILDKFYKDFNSRDFDQYFEKLLVIHNLLKTKDLYDYSYLVFEILELIYMNAIINIEKNTKTLFYAYTGKEKLFLDNYLENIDSIFDNKSFAMEIKKNIVDMHEPYLGFNGFNMEVNNIYELFFKIICVRYGCWNLNSSIGNFDDVIINDLSKYMVSFNELFTKIY